MAHARSEILKLHGYIVVTAFGNESAKFLLSASSDCNLFIVGYGPVEEARCEMDAWLKENYPKVRIVAVNAPTAQRLPGADYNVKLNGPEILLPVLAAALGINPE